MLRIALVLSAVAVLPACTTASTTMLTENTAVISARDMNLDSRKAIRDRALFTAAQAARARGYDYFGVVEIRDATTPNSVQARGQINANCSSCSAGSIQFRDLGEDVTVRFLRQDELPADRDGIYSASSVLAAAEPLQN